MYIKKNELEKVKNKIPF